MKVGTKSLLFGVHQFIWHPLTVVLAWRKLYRSWPNWWQLISIFCHDLGYWGKPNMDGLEGREHPYRGALLAAAISGPIWRFFHDWADIDREEVFKAVVYDFTLGHSRELAGRRGVEPSKLCWADKYCVCVEPRWMYLFRARMSDEIIEYMRNAKSIENDLFLLSLHGGGFSSFAEEYWLDWYRKKVTKLPEVEKLLKPAPNCFIPTL